MIGVMSKTLKSAEESADLANQIGVGDNAKPYKSITDMIADPKINALWVCSPNFTRIETFEEIASASSLPCCCMAARPNTDGDEIRL